VNDGLGIGHKLPLLVLGEGFPVGRNGFLVARLPTATKEEIQTWARELAKPLPPLPEKPPADAQRRGVVNPAYPRVGVLEEVTVGQQGLLWAVNPDGVSAPYHFGKPQPWWLSPKEAEPGDLVMMFGRDIYPLYSESNVILTPAVGGAPIFAEPRNWRTDAPHTVFFRIPSATPPGAYKLWVHTGAGGRWGFAGPLDLAVAAPHKDLPTVVSCAQYGAKGDGTADDTAALKAALAAAKPKSILSLAPGTYNITETLVLPEGVTLRGSGQENTVIRGLGYRPDGPRRSWWSQLAIPASAVRVTSRAALSDVTVVGALANGVGDRGLVEIDSGPNVEFTMEATVRDVRVRPGDHKGRTIYRSAISSGNIKDCQIVRCDLLSAIGLGSITWGCRLRQNRVESGAISSRSFNECWIEGNILTRGGKGFVLALEPWGSRHNYIHWNEVHDVWGWEHHTDGEAYLFHGETEGVRWGRTISWATGATPDSLTDLRVTWSQGVHKNSTVLLIGGRGMGQYRQVIANDEHTLKLERPWRTVPDPTTRYVVCKAFVENMVQANMQRSRGAIQLWYDSIGNEIRDHRTTGEPTAIYVCGGDRWDGKNEDPRRQLAFLPAYFNRIMGCRADGATIHVSNDGPAAGLREPAAFGNIVASCLVGGTGAVHSARFDAGIGMFGGRKEGPQGVMSAMNLFYGNTVRGSPIGIRIDNGAEFTWVKGNTLKDTVEPIQDQGADTTLYENQRAGALTPASERLPEPRSERHLERPSIPSPGPIPAPHTDRKSKAEAALRDSYRRACLAISTEYSVFLGTEDTKIVQQCAHNLRRVYAAIQAYDEQHGRLPDAVFWPDRPRNNPRSLVVLLPEEARPYLVCPGFDADLASVGLCYVWNEKLSGRPLSSISKPDTTWLLMDVVATHSFVAARVGHRGGTNVLYADGTVRCERADRDNQWWDRWILE